MYMNNIYTFAHMHMHIHIYLHTCNTDMYITWLRAGASHEVGGELLQRKKQGQRPPRSKFLQILPSEEGNLVAGIFLVVSEGDRHSLR